MLKLGAYALAAIAVIFSLAAYGADSAIEKSEPQPAPVAKDAATGDELGSDPIKFIRSAVQADSMGYLYAVVYNPSDVTVSNVYVVAVHINPANGQPDNQSDPLLVAKRLAPKQYAHLQLQGLQVYKPADLKLYRVIVAKAELAQ